MADSPIQSDETNVKLTLSYDGTDFAGFQTQKNCRTIEEELVRAISTMNGQHTSLVCAGRTDSGVHAEGQAVNFYSTKKKILEFNWLRGLNSILPKDIRINQCEFVPHSFNARRSAIYREYWYRLSNTETVSALETRFTSCFNYIRLNKEIFEESASYLVGEHDFSAFCSIGEQSPSKSRFIHSIRVEQSGDLFIFKIVANAFLQHMIRIIMGTLLQIQKDKLPPAIIKEILLSKNRNQAGPTWYPKGLIFKKVYYDESVYKKEYHVPDRRLKTGNDESSDGFI